jgi:hypothetical protein
VFHYVPIFGLIAWLLLEEEKDGPWSTHIDCSTQIEEATIAFELWKCNVCQDVSIFQSIS